MRDIRPDFPILKRKVNGKPLIYFDNAATSQKPKAVIDAIATFYKTSNANIHRGIHTLSEEATAQYEDVRNKVATFIHAPRAEEIIFTRNTTESINLVAQTWGRANIKAGDEILLTEMEHHSNIVPWQMLAKETGAVLRFIPVTKEGELDLQAFSKLFNVKTKFLGVVHVSNVLGTINPIQQIVHMAKEKNITVLVDGAQSVPHMPVDVKSLGCDFFVFSAHKMMGPTGVGVLWGKKELLDAMPPFLGGGDMIKEVRLDESLYQDAPHKFEAGTPNIADVIGFGAALDYLQILGMRNIQEAETALTAYALQKLSRIKGITLYGPTDLIRRGSVICFNVGNIHAHDVATLLDEEGIAIRSGHHCAMPLMKVLGIPACARISFAPYNTTKEIDTLMKALEKVKNIFAKP